MMATRVTVLVCALGMILAVGGLAVGCESDAEDRSPPVTLGTAGPAASSGSEGAAEPAEAEELAPSTERMPPATEEQETLLLAARTAFLIDDYDAAERLFEELALSDPATGATVSATLALGQIYIETGRPARALEFFDTVRERLDESPELLLVIARVYKDLGRHQRALEAYDQAFMARQDYLFILTEMAEILLAEGEEDRASELLFRYEQQLANMAMVLESGEQVPVAQRLFVVDIFSLLHDERAHQALIVALDDPDGNVRLHAAQAVGDLFVVEAEPALRRIAVEDRSDEVRQVARASIQTLRSLRSQ